MRCAGASVCFGDDAVAGNGDGGVCGWWGRKKTWVRA